MISILTQHSGYINRLLSGAASLLALFSFSIRAENITQNDIQAWLTENAPQAADPEAGIYYSTGEFIIYPNNTSGAWGQTSATTHKNGYKNKTKNTYKDVAKAKERKLLRQISDKLKVNLFKTDSKYSNHRLYINTLKRELVGKSRIGKAKYEIRVSEKQAEAHFRYTF